MENIELTGPTLTIDIWDYLDGVNKPIYCDIQQLIEEGKGGRIG